MSRKDLIEGAMEISAEGTREAVEVLAPGAADIVDDSLDFAVPGWKAIRGCWDLYHRAKAERYMQKLVEYYALDEGEIAAAKLQGKLRDDRHVRERVAQGYRQILESWDEHVHDCIAMLVVDSIRKEKTPRDYQLAARLLAESDIVMLAHLERITRLYVEVLDHGVPDTLPDRGIGEYSPHSGERRAWVVAMHLLGLDANIVASSHEEVGVGFDAAVGALLRHDFGDSPTSPAARNSGLRGYPDPHVVGDAVLIFRGHRHDARMRALNTYLQPFRHAYGKL